MEIATVSVAQGRGDGGAGEAPCIHLYDDAEVQDVLMSLDDRVFDGEEDTGGKREGGDKGTAGDDGLAGVNRENGEQDGE